MTTAAEDAERATFEERYRAAVAETVDLRADRENANRVIKELQALLPTSDHVVILKADYERLIASLPVRAVK